MKKTLLTVVTPTLNNGRDIKRFLESLSKQNRNGFNFEIVVADGGSVDDTKKIARQYKARVINNPHVFADPGVDIGIKNAKGELIIVLAVDNIFVDKNALGKIVSVFEDKDITAAFPMHASDSTDSIFTKYINRFTDPFNHFVYGYASNARSFKRIYTTLTSNKIYDVYDFSTFKDKPLIAVAQGFTVRAGFTRNRKNAFDDILPVIDLIDKRKKIAFVHSVKLYHHTVRDLRHFANKQMWATINALQRRNYGIAHRLSYLSQDQKLRVKIWPFYSLTILPSIVRAAYGLIKEREVLWIFHPVLCMISAYASVLGTIIYLLNKDAEFKRK